MKKVIILFSLAICIIAGLEISSCAEVLGYVYDSNTNAFIDGYPIPVYTYNNYPYIVAEDLNGYGFDCKWEANEDILYINYNSEKTLFPYEYVELIPAQGKIIENVYRSDTKVRLGNKFITAYSIGGRMLISLDELYVYGSVNWYPASQTIAFTSQRFIEHNPDWKILMPANYILDVTNNYTKVMTKYLNECWSELIELNKYFKKYGYEKYNDYAYKAINLPLDIKNKLSLINGQLLYMASSIQDNHSLYYKSEAYHFVYAAALSVQNAMSLYDEINGKNYDSVFYSSKTGVVTNSFELQMNIFVSRYEEYSNKVLKYICY